MESKESLGQLSIIKTLGKEKIGYNRLVLTSSDKVVDALSFILDTGSIQFRIECELLDACKELLLEIIGWNFIVSIQELKEILEHTAGSTGSRNELQNLIVSLQIFLPEVLVIRGSVVVDYEDAIFWRGSSLKLQIRETSFK